VHLIGSDVESHPSAIANTTIRRIMNLTIDPGATIRVGERRFVSSQVTFDTGALESPVLEIIELTSSEASILRTGSGSAEMDRISVWGVAPGTASVTGRYLGVASSPKQLQVVPQ
jgi:hypothetical protein